MRIAVVGAGNMGTLIAAEFASKGNSVRLFTSTPADVSLTIDVLGAENELLAQGVLSSVTDDLSSAVEGADMIWVTYPTFMFPSFGKQLEGLIQAGQVIVVLPGADAEFSFKGCVDTGAVLLGLQRVHCVARLKERGKSVYMLGRRGELQLASVPADAASGYAPVIEELFDIPVRTLPNYLIETLTPSNPILHTTRLCSLFSDWKPGVTYPANILFYETWDDASSELLITCDAENQEICRALERLLDIDLTEVRSLKLHYESPDAAAMTHKIAHIPAFKGLGSPMKEIAPGTWVPDFSSRYFRADFAYGLKTIRDLAAVAGVETPHIDQVWYWYLDVTGETEFFDGVPTEISVLGNLYHL